MSFWKKIKKAIIQQSDGDEIEKLINKTLDNQNQQVLATAKDATDIKNSATKTYYIIGGTLAAGLIAYLILKK